MNTDVYITQASQAEGHRMTEEEARKLAEGALQWADHTAEEMFNANELTDEIAGVDR